MLVALAAVAGAVPALGPKARRWRPPPTAGGRTGVRSPARSGVPPPRSRDVAAGRRPPEGNDARRGEPPRRARSTSPRGGSGGAGVWRAARRTVLDRARLHLQRRRP